MKRRLCRMLLLTISFRKSRGELRGDSLGEVALRFPPPTPGTLGGSSSRCMCSLNVRMQESISTLSSLDDIPAAFSSSALQSKLTSDGWWKKLYVNVEKASSGTSLAPAAAARPVLLPFLGFHGFPDDPTGGRPVSRSLFFRGA